MMNKKKNLLVKTVFTGVLLLSILLPAFADSASRGLPYLHIVDAINSDVSQFNEKGVAVDPTDPPQALGRGWTILTGFDPVVIKIGMLQFLFNKSQFSLLSRIKQITYNSILLQALHHF